MFLQKKEDPTFDPSGFGDPIAMQTEWKPLHAGGASFRTHKLVMVNPRRQEFKASVGALLFYLVFFLGGIGFLILVLADNLSSQGKLFSSDVIVPLGIGLIFMLVGFGMLYFGSTPIVFDKSLGLYWKGRKSGQKWSSKEKSNDCLSLDEIYALQLLSEYCSGGKSSFYSYELNLVLQDGRRVNVIDHGNRKRLCEDTKILAEFLGKPIWNAIS